jgi:hypothetical protein
MNRRVWKRSDTLIALVALAAAVPGVARDISVFFWKAGELRTTRSEDRFAGLSLPPGERPGFVTDASGGDATRRYYEALYAFAPRILVQSPEARWVVADVQDPGQLARLCAERKMHVVARASPGVALLEAD